MMGAFLRAIFGGLGLADLLKIGAKFAMFVAFIGLIQIFVSYLLSHIPALNLVGCAGYYAKAWGFIDGFRLLISIVLYGFVVKFGINMFSRLLD